MSATEPSKPNRVKMPPDQILKHDRTVRSLEAALARYGLSIFQLSVLVEIAAHPDSAIGHVGQTIGASPPKMTGAIDALAMQGLVMRTASINVGSRLDRRSVHLTLTDQGRALLAALEGLEIEVER